MSAVRVRHRPPVPRNLRQISVNIDPLGSGGRSGSLAMTTMDTSPAALAAAPKPALSPALRLAPALFAATLFLSALLLFAVQPMFTKMVLPKLGGAPSVWSI